MYYFNIKLQNLFFILIFLFFLFDNWSNYLSANAKGITRPSFPSHIPRTFSNLRFKSNPVISRGRPNTKNAAVVHRNFGVRGRNLLLSGHRKAPAHLRAPAAPLFVHKPPASIANIPLNLIFTPGAPGTG